MKKVYAGLIVSLFLLGTVLPVALAMGEVRTGSDDYSDTRTGGTTFGRDIETAGHGGSWFEDFETTGTTANMTGTRMRGEFIQMDIDMTSLTRDASNPVLSVGAPSSWDDSSTSWPNLLYEDGIFKMWYTGDDGSPPKIGYATSFNGKTWTKQNSGNYVIDGTAGWDQYLRAGPVIKDGGIYKMWYTGSNGTKNQIGYATSPDGIIWTRQNGGNPVMTTGLGWESHHVICSSVIKEGNTYKMWYYGNSGTYAVNRIGYATSNNGINWVKSNNNPVLSTGANGKFDDIGVMWPSVFKHDDGKYYMVYTGYDGSIFQIGLASSWDGIDWVKENNGNAILALGGGGAWDSDGIWYASVLRFEDRFMVYYSGESADSFRIGLAEGTSYLTTGQLTSEPIDAPQSMSWDMVELEKRSPQNTNIKVSVIDATTYQVVPGFDNKTNGAVDISSIDTATYPSIRLKAYFSTTDQSVTPGLMSWGVSWVAQRTWRDSFIGKASTIPSLEMVLRDGSYILNADPTDWQKDNTNPVMTLGAPGSWEDFGHAHGGIMEVNGVIEHWYAANDGSTLRIGHANSTDGNSWTKDPNNPIVDIGAPGRWDDVSVYQSWIVPWSDSFIMYFDGFDGSSKSIGMAVSGDMSNWIKTDLNPVLEDSPGSWDGNGRVGGPSVIYLNGTWYMWYSGMLGTGWSIGIAKSSDGFDWNKPANNQVIGKGAAGSWEDFSVHTTSVVYYNDEFHMFYTGGDGSSYRIGHAISTDGVNWVKEAGNPVLTLGAGGSWDDEDVQCPSVYMNDEGLFVMYYQGYSGSTMRVGRAYSNRYDSGNVISESIQVSENGLWDILKVNKTEPSGTSITVSVLDEATESVIPGYDQLTLDEIDISGINATTHPTLKLKADFVSSGTISPILSDWSVNWTPAQLIHDMLIPNVSFYEDTFGDDLIDLSDHFDHEKLSIDDLTFTIATNSDLAHILGEIDVSGILVDFSSLEENWTGIAEFSINATDGLMTLTSNTFTVTVEPVNDPPVWGPIPKQWLEGNSTYDDLLDLSVHILDVDNDISDMTFSLEGSSDDGNLTVTMDPVGTADFETFFDFEGDITVTVAVNDTVDQVQTTFEVHINESGRPPENRPPEITSDPVTGATVGEEYQYQVWAQDPDGDALVYMLDLAPEGMVIHPLTGLITWTPTDDQTGLVPVTVNVSDVKGLYDLQDYTILVTTPNEAPVFLSEPPTTVRVGEEWLYNPKVEDPDSLFVFVLLESGPTGIEIDLLGTELTWRPGEDQVGDHTVVIYATDLGLLTYQNFTITVLPFNRPPTLSMISDQEVVVGQTFIYTVIASDPDNDTLHYNIQKGPTGVTVDDSGTISWIPDKNDVRGHSVTINVTDGEFTVSETFVINVLKKEKKPGHQETGDWLWLILLVIIIAVVVVAVIVLSKRRPPEHEEMAGPGAGYAEPPPPPQPPPPMAPEPEPELLEEEPVIIEELKEGPEAGPSGEDVTIAAILAKAGPEKDKERMKTIEIDGSSYTKTDILKRLTSLPRGLPSGLWGKDMDDLAEEVINAVYSETPEGDLVMRIGRKYYYGDPKELGTFMQAYKGSIIKDDGG